MTPAKGNKNAFKHGLYAKRIKGEEKEAIDKLSYSDIQGEIAYLRIVCSRMANLLETNGLSEKDTKIPSDPAMKTLNSFTLALERLSNLIRIHALLNGDLKDFEKEIEEGKFLARTYFGVYDYLKSKPTKRTSKKS